MAEEGQDAGQNNTDTGGQNGNGQGGEGGAGGDAGGEDTNILTGNAGEGGEKGGKEGGDNNQSGTDGTGEGDGEAGDDAGDQGGAPESYEAFTTPEGMEADQGLIDGVSPVLKELDLSQEKAQKLIDAYNGIVQERAKEQAEETANIVKGWIQSIKDDKDYGGDKFDETAKLANKAVSAFDKGDLVGLLKRTGLANHPEIIKAFAEAGKLISEDGNFNNGNGAGGGDDEEGRAKRMFPNS